MEEQSKLTIDQGTNTKFMDKGMLDLDTSSKVECDTLNNCAQVEDSKTLENEHSLGKFSSVEELQKAYKSLEAEFTKRSQKLAEYQNKTVTWQEKVDNFLQKNPDAKSYAEQIVEEFKLDESIKNEDNALDIAYQRALKKQIVPYNELATDSDFLDKYIYSNPEVTTKIITSYLSNLKHQSPVNLIGEGGSFATSPNTKPKSIRDCGEYVEKLFN